MRTRDSIPYYRRTWRCIDAARCLWTCGQDVSSGKLVMRQRQLTRAEIEGKLGELAFKQGDNIVGRRGVEKSLRLLGRRIPTRSIAVAVFLVWEVLVQALHTALPRLFLGRRLREGNDREFLAIRLYTHLARATFFDRGKVPVSVVALTQREPV